LTELPLSEREKRFIGEFPGRIARFTDGEREIIIRWITNETRKLHPSADCFKALGYTLHPMPIRVAAEGSRWSSFEALRGNEKLRVYERIYDQDGNSWVDVSAWYWAALTDNTKGPWWAVTIAESELKTTE
jgi:hypothetical protein